MANLPPVSKSRDQAGKAVGVSGKSIDHAANVQKLGCPELQKMVSDGDLAVSKAAKIAKEVKCPEEQISLAKNETTPKSRDGESEKQKAIKAAEAMVKSVEQLHWLQPNPTAKKDSVDLLEDLIRLLRDWKPAR